MSTVSKKKKILFVLTAVLMLLFIIIFVSELILYFLKIETIDAKMQAFSMNQAKWWTCDSINGPRYVKNQVSMEDSIRFKNDPWYYQRLQIVNNQGYHDRDDFNEIISGRDSLKVLFAGDSFTWGASADVDSSYVEVFERNIKKVYPSVVWNTGIPATGTNHALFTTKKFLPVQKSDFVLLGFYVGNDFGDNLLPFDQLIFNEKASCFNICENDADFNPVRISRREAYRKATGAYPPEELGIVQKIAVRSRLYSFLITVRNGLLNRLSGNKNRSVKQEYIMTREYLKKLNDYTKANNAELIVFVIPTWLDIKKREEHYLNIIKILNELSINHVETIELYKENNYLKRGGSHWNNGGHIIAGNALSGYFLDYLGKQRKLGKK